MLLPDTAGIRDDILRGSPLILYADVARRFDDFVAGGNRPKHRFFGATLESDVRALNPDLAYGRLRVSPKDHGYTRDVFVMGPDRGMELIGRLPNVEGVILDSDGRISVSSGLRDRVRIEPLGARESAPSYEAP